MRRNFHHGAVSDGGRPERTAVEGPDDGEEQDRTGRQVASEDNEIQEQTHKQDLLPGESVGQIAAERPDQQSREGRTKPIKSLVAPKCSFR